ncbi:MAG: hypothetical protein Q4C47_05395, partial [Planctomycetia bacterium]|nr:hypothetical protein [Planctomycetia bacterium]
MSNVLRSLGVLMAVSAVTWLLLGLIATGPARELEPEAVHRWSRTGQAVLTCLAGSVCALLLSAGSWARRAPVGAMLLS